MTSEVLEKLTQQYPTLRQEEFRGTRRIVIPSDSVHVALSTLKQSGFNLLVDVTCVDYLQYRGVPGPCSQGGFFGSATNPVGRFGLTYLLSNTTTGERLTVRAYVEDEDNPQVASVVPLWEGANWLEREVWDMFGIHFVGHPDLRRILMPPEFTAYPLRKDYPLQGRGERHNFPTITRGQA